MEKMLLRPDEAAQMLRVSRWTIYRWLTEGRIRGTRVGRGTVRVFKDSIDRLIEENDLSHPDEPGLPAGGNGKRK
jgi:excisionase family DNA binding protein